jgi:hypothetical protein
MEEEEGLQELLAFDPYATMGVIAHPQENEKTRPKQKKQDTEHELEMQQLQRVFLAA